jgi:hypothetical protein
MFGMYHNSDRVFRHSRGDSGIQLDHSKLVSTNVFIRVREGRLDFGADEDNQNEPFRTIANDLDWRKALTAPHRPHRLSFL